MVLVTLSPEGVSSFRRLPKGVKVGFDEIIGEIVVANQLRLPGRYRAHQLQGSPKLWTIKIGQFRGICRWDGSELRFIRFGRFDQVYYGLPK